MCNRRPTPRRLFLGALRLPVVGRLSTSPPATWRDSTRLISLQRPSVTIRACPLWSRTAPVTTVIAEVRPRNNRRRYGVTDFCEPVIRRILPGTRFGQCRPCAFSRVIIRKRAEHFTAVVRHRFASDRSGTPAFFFYAHLDTFRLKSTRRCCPAAVRFCFFVFHTQISLNAKLNRTEHGPRLTALYIV